MTEDWLARWQQGRTGWHEKSGNAALRKHWPTTSRAARVLVPLCGKSRDLRWLADQGWDVTGVELSPLAIEAFMDEEALLYDKSRAGDFVIYRARDLSITLCCGDYFAFDEDGFDALYDRGGLVAIPGSERRHYLRHTAGLLQANAFRLLITLEFDETRVTGPPHSVSADEVLAHWPDMQRVSAREDIENAPPKFRAAGLTSVREVVWVLP
jgi:thiopurine S-methyltransferase